MHRLLLSCLLLVPVVSGQLWVPDDFPTIQAAINAANPGQTVFVRPLPGNAYLENLEMRSRVSVKGIPDPAGQRPRVVAFVAAQPTVRFGDPATRWDTAMTGLELLNSVAEKGAGIHIVAGASPVLYDNKITYQRSVFGAGIWCGPGSRPLIWQNLIEGCAASFMGGGIYLDRPGPGTLVWNNVLLENTARFGAGLLLYRGEATVVENAVIGNAAGWSGGGIYAYASTLVLRGNRYERNEAGTQGTGHGGGLYLNRVQDPQVADEVMVGNQADRGGGVYLYACRADLEGATVQENFATLVGGGIAVRGNGPGALTISGCNVHRNVAGMDIATGAGGGIYLETPDPVTVVNTFVTRNRAGYNDLAGCGIRVDRYGNTVIVNSTVADNDAHGNHQGSGISIGAGPCDVINTISCGHQVEVSRDALGIAVLLSHNHYEQAWLGQLNASPTDLILPGAFVNRGVDYHLRAGAPDVNAGMVGGPVPLLDIDGDARLWGKPDIGADER